jgi:hypothetical protein
MKRFRVDLSGELRDVLNNPMVTSPTDETLLSLARVMQDGLSKAQTDVPLKVWTWAMDLTNNTFLVLDQPDRSKLREIVTKFTIFDFAKAQLLLAIDNAVEELREVSSNP